MFFDLILKKAKKIKKILRNFTEDKRITYNEIKNLLNNIPKDIQLEKLTTKDKGLINIQYKGIKYSTFIIPSNTEKLYILLNTGSIETNFSRVSWSTNYDGVTVCIDDPSKLLYKKEYLWYFGDKDNDYTIYIRDIVKYIASLYHIRHKNIIFLGSSNAGFCAVRLAGLIPYSKAISLNGQFDARLWILDYRDRNDYEKIGYFDEKHAKRLTLVEAFNKKSKYMFFYNISSVRDNKQLSCLCKFIGITKPEKSGFYRKENIFLFILKTQMNSPHTLFPDQNMCKIMEYTLYKGPTKATVPTFQCLAQQLDLSLKYENIKNKTTNEKIHNKSPCKSEHCKPSNPVLLTKLYRYFYNKLKFLSRKLRRYIFLK